MARVLKERMGPAARRVPAREIPDWLVRAFALVDPTARQIVPELGKIEERDEREGDADAGLGSATA